MSKRKKRLERIRQNPKNIMFDELRRLLEDYGFYVDRIVGCHHTFKRSLENDIFVIPYRSPKVKTGYVEKVIVLIERIIAESGEEEDTDD